MYSQDLDALFAIKAVGAHIKKPVLMKHLGKEAVTSLHVRGYIHTITNEKGSWLQLLSPGEIITHRMSKIAELI